MAQGESGPLPEEVSDEGSRSPSRKEADASERFGSLAPMSAPIVSVGLDASPMTGLENQGSETQSSESHASESHASESQNDSASPAELRERPLSHAPPSGRKLVPPPKPKRDSSLPPPEAPAAPAGSAAPSGSAPPPKGAVGVDGPAGRLYFPPPSALPRAPELSQVPRKPSTPPRPAASVPPVAPAPPRAVSSPPSLSPPRVPSFPVARGVTSTNPPPTLPSGTSPSRYPWMSSATVALADGNSESTPENRGLAPPDRSSPVAEASPQKPPASNPSNPASPSIEPPPTSAPNSAPRAAVLPRATRDPVRRSSTPPPKPRLVPPRPQKETPSVAIEAMRIIAIGTDEQLPEAHSLRGPELEQETPLDALPQSPLPHLEERDEPSGESPALAPSVESLASDAIERDPLQDRALAASDEDAVDIAELEAASAPEPVPHGAAEAEEASTEILEAEPVDSARKPPPPRRRASLPSAPSEPQIAVDSLTQSERELVVAAIAADDPEPQASPDSAREVVEMVETVETVEAAPQPPKSEARAGAPPPPSRVPRNSQPSLAKAPESAEPSSTAAAEMPKARPRRPWWEELFNEDFSRALVRLSETQVEQEVTFIEESLGLAPGAVVLDLGCGSGEHAVELAGRGYGVVGYDLSLHQLALAQETAQEHGQKLNFLQGDMREMAFEEVFDGIFCWNTTFGYFEEDKNILVAERMFAALKPGGTLLLDVINRDFAAMDQPSSVWYEGDSCVCMDDMSIDFLTSRMRVKRSLILDDGRTRECTYSIRLYSLHELGKMLHDIGFRVTEASGHPTTPGVFLGQSSPHILILAQKP